MLSKIETRSYYPLEFLPLRLSSTHRTSMYSFPQTTDINSVGKAQAELLVTLLHMWQNDSHPSTPHESLIPH